MHWCLDRLDEIRDSIRLGDNALLTVHYGIQDEDVKFKCEYCGVISSEEQCPACGAWRK